VFCEKPFSGFMGDNLNDLSHRIIGIAIGIHKKLGPGFQEKALSVIPCLTRNPDVLSVSSSLQGPGDCLFEDC